jgi:serine/threonine-protein kinase
MLPSGTRLGPYEIECVIGAGGMGEVYKARDTRLDRVVAIKVLPPRLADDPNSLERFKREAKSISSLSHPNICALYDVGEAPGGIHYLVLEYLTGETLSARIARGPLPLSVALKIATEIAGALDNAHRNRIVHRDLKPANVMLTKEGSKLLDFGLARAGNNADNSIPFAADSEMPTLTAPLTEEKIRGTIPYMAPEQIEGQQADARTDLFSFGAVLYEMLTARRAFEGRSRAGLIGSILRDDPPSVIQIRPKTPPALDRLIRACLAKNPENRLQNAYDLWLALKWIADSGTVVELSPPAAAHRGYRHLVPWMASALVLAAVAGAASWTLKPSPPAVHVVARFQYSLPEGQNFKTSWRHLLAISPDGTKLAYVANKQLYLRSLDRLEAQPVRGTDEDPTEPVFSPDGQWLAYFAREERTDRIAGHWLIRKVGVAGGTPVTLGQLTAPPYGAVWRNGTIAFGVNTGSEGGVFAMAESGGTVRPLISVDPKKEQVAQPQLLADGKHLLFVVAMRGSEEGESQIVIQTLGGNDRRKLIPRGTDPHVLPTGHLIYIHDGVLLAVPFDMDRLVVTGGAVPVVEGVAETTATMAGQFAVSSDGTLVFSPVPPSEESRRVLVWVDRQGHEQPIPAKPRVYSNPGLSPDGARIAVSSTDEEHNIWIFDLAKETLTPLTFGPAREADPVWTPDNKYLFFSSISVPGAGSDIFRKAVDGTGAVEGLTQHGAGDYPRSVSPDGKWLVFEGYLPNPGLWLLPLEPKGPARALIADPNFGVYHGRISPDGRWIAYDSDESGHIEVYVRPFPAVETGRWQISAEGGSNPLWARSGRELFFRTAANQLAVVNVQTGPSGFIYDKPRPLFDASVYTNMRFDISRDGKRFLAVKPASKSVAARPSLVVVTHWFDELRAKVPTR